MDPLPVRRGYELWAPSYLQGGDNPLSRLAADLVEALVPTRTTGLLLDLGCGTGRHLPFLEAEGAQALGIDLSARMLHRAAAGGKVLAADLRHLPLADGTASGALASLCLSHVPDPLPALREWARVLEPGGWVVLVDLHPATKALGWRRSFRGPAGERLAIRWHAHDLDALCHAARDAAFEVRVLRSAGLRAEQLGPDAPPSALQAEALYGLLLRRRPTHPGA